MNLQTLQVMRKCDIQLLLDNHILDPHADEFTAWQVWGKLCKDPIVKARAAEVKARPENQPPHYNELSGLFCYDAVQIVAQEMTESEKEALRDRVIAACTARRKP